MTDTAEKSIPLYKWALTEPDDYRMWCYAGGRRFLFADCILENGKGYKGWIYDVDLDTFKSSDHPMTGDDLEYIKSCTGDFEKAYAIADCIEHDREVGVFETEEEMWSRVAEIRS